MLTKPKPLYTCGQDFPSALADQSTVVLGAASQGSPAALSQQCQSLGHPLTVQAINLLPNLTQVTSSGFTSYERRATVRLRGSHGTCAKEHEGYEGETAAIPLRPRLLTTQQGPAQDARSPEHQTDNFWGLGPATAECDQSWVGLGDTICLMALSTANSHTAFSRAVKDLDIQIHIPDQFIDLFFTTHSPAPPALPQTGPVPGEY